MAGRDRPNARELTGARPVPAGPRAAWVPCPAPQTGAQAPGRPRPVVPTRALGPLRAGPSCLQPPALTRRSPQVPAPPGRELRRTTTAGSRRPPDRGGGAHLRNRPADLPRRPSGACTRRASSWFCDRHAIRPVTIAAVTRSAAGSCGSRAGADGWHRMHPGETRAPAPRDRTGPEERNRRERRGARSALRRSAAHGALARHRLATTRSPVVEDRSRTGAQRAPAQIARPLQRHAPAPGLDLNRCS
jgi:hypothetical protein